jgi:alanine-glyoxylate transaminase/serine-glyoxylate transaminase/serine-pyruvate transaminase
VDDGAVRTELLRKYNLEIGAGLGGFADKVWRIVLMGYASRESSVLFCLAALQDVLSRQ